MSVVVILAARGVLIALAVWLFGGFVLRTGGAFFALGGLAIAALYGSPGMAIAAILGGVAWLAGQWLFAVRRHYFSSPLARRIFLEVLPRRVDPTRGWGIPNVPPERRG
ncbi:MAG: hypothetical protein ACRDK7_06730 [Solirubrobacteraceae bacterium]